MAILGVILVHSSQSVAPTNVTLLWFMGEGARGVQLFYVASALTLCMSWVARSSHETFPIRNFYIRRFFRIAPMFYLAILSYIFREWVFSIILGSQWYRMVVCSNHGSIPPRIPPRNHHISCSRRLVNCCRNEFLFHPAIFASAY